MKVKNMSRTCLGVIILCALLAGIVTAAAPAMAGTTVVAEHPGINSGYWSRITSGQYAQTFTTGPSAAHANAVELPLHVYQGATIHVSVTETTYGLPDDAAVLASGSRDCNWYNTLGWFQISLGSGTPLAANTEYALVVTAIPAAGWADWNGTWTSGYTDGNMCVYSGSSWQANTQAPNGDYFFKVLNVVPDYSLTVATNPAGIGSTTGSGLYEAGVTVSIGAPQMADYAGSPYLFDGWTGATVADALSPSTTITMPAGATIVTANYTSQSIYDTLTVATNPAGIASTTGSGDYASRATVPISAPENIDIAPGESRYHFNGWTGEGVSFTDASSPSTTMTMPAGATTVTANYVTQYRVTFDQSGIGADASATVLTVGGAEKTAAELPFTTDWITSGTPLTYAYSSPVGVNESKQYVWASTSGLSQTSQGNTFSVTGAGAITGNYNAQYKIIFDAASLASNIRTDTTATIVTVAGADKTGSDLPFTTDWINAGDYLSFEFASLVNGTSGAKYEFYRIISNLTGLDPELRSNTFAVNAGGKVAAVYFCYGVVVSPTTQQYSDNVDFTAYITPNIPGEPMPTDVHFYVGDQDMGPADVISQHASLNTVLLETVNGQMAAGTKVVTAKWDDLDSSINPTTWLTITKEDAAVTYTGDEGFMYTAGPSVDKATIRLSAHLDQEDDGYPGDITKATVDFLIYKGSSVSGTPNITVGNVPVDAAGNALTSIQLTADQWCIIAAITPANGYWTSEVTSDPALVTIDPGDGSQMATGGGWVADAKSINGKANFGFTVNYQKKGTPKGNSTFLFRGADGYNYLVKSNSWAGGGLTFYNTAAASFSGKCVIQKIDRSTGLVVESKGNCFFTVDILDGDLKKPKASDMYAITVLSDGLVWHQVGDINAPVGIGGGNIVVHSK